MRILIKAILTIPLVILGAVAIALYWSVVLVCLTVAALLYWLYISLAELYNNVVTPTRNSVNPVNHDTY